MANNDVTLRMHWHIPLRRQWFEHTGDHGGRRIPIVEKESGLLVCTVERRRSLPYTLATARAIVRSNNQAATAARKEKA